MNALKKSIDNIDTPTLVSYITLVDLFNENCLGFLHSLEGEVKEGTFPITTFNEIESEIKERLDRNNEIVEIVDNIVMKRVEKRLPGSSTQSHLIRLIKKAKKAKENFAASTLTDSDKKKVEETKSKKLNLKIEK